MTFPAAEEIKGGCRGGRKLTDLIVVEVIETLKGEVLLLDLLDHFLWQFLELSQWGH